MEGMFIPLTLLGVSGILGLCLWVSERPSGGAGAGRVTDSWDDTRHRSRRRHRSAPVATPGGAAE